MKKIKYIFAIVIASTIFMTSCEKKFLGLTDLEKATVAVYYKTPDQFKAGAAELYTGMIGLRKYHGVNIQSFLDPGTDISGGGYNWPSALNQTDVLWDNAYIYLREANNIPGNSIHQRPERHQKIYSCRLFFQGMAALFLA
jgi:hypothetical protein